MTSAYAADVQVEVAFGSTPSTAPASRTWYDVSGYVELADGISITGGRADERAVADANTASFTLDNADGRFTPELAAGAYYPNVLVGVPVRVVTRYPTDTVGNLVSANNASVETSVGDWAGNTELGAYPDLPSAVAQSATRANNGTKSVRVTWPTTATGSAAIVPVAGLVVGRTYTASLYVYVPAGDADVRMHVAFTSSSAYTSTKAAWTRLFSTFVATSGTHYIGVDTVSSTAGDYCYIDSAMVNEGSTAATFTTSSPADRTRFSGFVDAWSVEWPDGVDNYSACRVAASSRLARLGSSTALNSVLYEEIAADSPALYLPLGEAAGAVEATAVIDRNSVNFKLQQTGAGSRVVFGDEHGPAGDESTAAKMSEGGKSFKGTPWLALTTTHAVEIIYTSVAGGANTTALWYAESVTNTDSLSLSVQSDGTVGALFSDVSATQYISASAKAADVGVRINDGNPHHIAYTLSGSTLTVYLDGMELATDTNGSASFPAANWWRVFIGPVTAADVSIALSHLVYHDAALSAARIAAHAAASVDIGSESAYDRLTMLAGFAGVPATNTDVDTGATQLVAYQDTSGVNAVEAMRTVEATEGGVLYDARNGDLTYDGRTQRTTASAAVSLSFTAGEVGAGVGPTYDRAALVNDATVSFPTGTVRTVDDASIALYGQAATSLTTSHVTDGEAYAAASWLTSMYATPEVRVPSLPVADLTQLDTAKLDGALSLDVGSLVETTGWPDQFGFTDLSLFVEGYSESIGLESHLIVLNVSPADLWLGTFILNDATRGELNSAYYLA